MPTLSAADIQAAQEAFQEPLSSPCFNPWPLEPIIDWLETQDLKREDFREECLDALRRALDAHAGNPGLSRVFFSTRALRFLDALRSILDGVERESRLSFVRDVLISWEKELQCHASLR